MKDRRNTLLMLGVGLTALFFDGMALVYLSRFHEPPTDTHVVQAKEGSSKSPERYATFQFELGDDAQVPGPR